MRLLYLCNGFLEQLTLNEKIMSAIIIAIYMWLGIQFGITPGEIRLIEENKTAFPQQANDPNSTTTWDLLGI